jgi:hypothetical protein
VRKNTLGEGWALALSRDWLCDRATQNNIIVAKLN